MPCTANGRSRIITKTLTSPPTRPSTAPAMRELWTSGEQFAVVVEVEDLVPDVAAASVMRRSCAVVVVRDAAARRRAPTTTMRPSARMTSTGLP